MIGDRLVPFPDGLTVADVLPGGVAALRGLFDRVVGAPGEALADVRLLAPVDPPAVRDFVAFEEHVEGVSAGVEGPCPRSPRATACGSSWRASAR